MGHEECYRNIVEKFAQSGIEKRPNQIADGDFVGYRSGEKPVNINEHLKRRNKNL